jgi:N-acetylglutamate synthase-like GNAT family acetyltransferase
MNTQIDIVFCHAQAQDASRIQDLYLQLVNDSNINVMPEQIQKLEQDQHNFLFVGKKENVVIATAFLTICRDVMYGDQPFAILENVVIDMNARGSGIGQNFMKFIIAQGKLHRCTKIMLLSSSKRSDAHKFFEKCGFQGNSKLGFVNYINR